MLLDCWTEHLKYPDLRDKVVHEYKTTRYGGNPNNPYDKGQPTDIVLVEEKGSGITLIQDLGRAGVPVRSFNPGRMDKIQRLHSVSHLVANNRCYIPESTKVPGEFRTWATDFIAEICVFPNSLHDDQVDAFSQVMMLLRDQSWLSIDTFEEPEDYADDQKDYKNPYAI
jgi:predicted phage terminase large subunit-like protein